MLSAVFDRIFRSRGQDRGQSQDQSRKAPVPPAPTGDRCFDDQELRAARERLAATGDWTVARDVIDAAGDDWEVRAQRIGVLSELGPGEEGWLYGWLNAHPDDPAATLLLASMLAGRAADARGSASAANTSAEQFRAFAAMSARAAEVAARARDLADPRDPGPYAELLGTMFSSGDRGLIDHTYGLAMDRAPFDTDLNITYISLLCEKWYGSHQEMFATARAIAAAAPPGSGSAMIPYLAHFEYAMREFCWDTRTKASLRDVRRYFARPEVQYELDSCAAKWYAAGPPRLGRSTTLRHWAALGYVLADRKPEAKAVFDEIGPYLRPPAVVWGYFCSGRDDGVVNAWQWANS